MATDTNRTNMQKEIPAEESARQQYYMDKCRTHVAQFLEQNGYVPRACVVTFGCPFV
ncbi:MAG: hypothetical protein IJ794_02255 [Lachnospiraceae bacterium]|nr:hypothetical protein [Lachnospiraceae bacterium]